MAGGAIRRPIGDDDDDDDVDEGGNDGSGIRIGPPGSSSKKDKGKEKKVPAPGTIEYEGDERCGLCVQGDVERCVVDKAVQEKWAADWKAGIRKRKAPDGSMCQTCAQGRQRCLLPATAQFRPPVYKRKRGANGEVEEEAKVEGESEEPTTKRVKVSTKVGNAVGGPSKVQGEVTRFPSAVESATSAAESAARSAAASAAALQNLRSVGRDVVVSLRLMTYLVARLVEQGAAPLPRWLWEDVLQVGEDPICKGDCYYQA